MIEINYKPLSVNDVWRGRRFKTPKYTQYERDISFMLPRMKIPKGKLRVEFEFGFSSSGSDLDNPVKPFMDILQKKYKFNDSRVYEILLKKSIVKKGSEFIRFEITKYEN